MPKKKYLKYILSNDADTDLDLIFDYTDKEHGFNQAVSYLSDLEYVFDQLVINPTIGRERKDIKEGIFSIAEQYHTIFYTIEKNHILIVRVLHGHMDIPKYL